MLWISGILQINFKNIKLILFTLICGILCDLIIDSARYEQYNHNFCSSYLKWSRATIYVFIMP